MPAAIVYVCLRYGAQLALPALNSYSGTDLLSQATFAMSRGEAPSADDIHQATAMHKHSGSCSSDACGCMSPVASCHGTMAQPPLIGLPQQQMATEMAPCVSGNRDSAESSGDCVTKAESCLAVSPGTAPPTLTPFTRPGPQLLGAGSIRGSPSTSYACQEAAYCHSVVPQDQAAPTISPCYSCTPQQVDPSPPARLNAAKSSESMP